MLVLEINNNSILCYISPNIYKQQHIYSGADKAFHFTFLGMFWLITRFFLQK